jgi:hypothetical protein
MVRYSWEVSERPLRLVGDYRDPEGELEAEVKRDGLVRVMADRMRRCLDWYGEPRCSCDHDEDDGTGCLRCEFLILLRMAEAETRRQKALVEMMRYVSELQHDVAHLAEGGRNA